MSLYPNGLRAQHHISGKTTFRIRLSDRVSSCSPAQARLAPHCFAAAYRNSVPSRALLGYVRRRCPWGPRVNLPPSTHFLSDSEPRSLRSTIVTRFDATTDLSATRTGPACPSRASGWGLSPRRLGLPVLTLPFLCPHASANTPVLLLDAFATHFPNRRRPSPLPNQLGSHIARFEACSAFNFHSGLCAR
jgi:hypothetical protein